MPENNPPANRPSNGIGQTPSEPQGVRSCEYVPHKNVNIPIGCFFTIVNVNGRLLRLHSEEEPRPGHDGFSAALREHQSDALPARVPRFAVVLCRQFGARRHQPDAADRRQSDADLEHPVQCEEEQRNEGGGSR